MSGRATLSARLGSVTWGLMLGAGAAVAFGTAAPAVKAMSAVDLAPVNIIQARTVAAAVAFLVAVLLFRRGRLAIRAGDWPLILVYGVFTLSVNQVVYAVAVTRLPIGVALLLEYLSPMMVALWVRFVQRRRVSRLMWVGIGLALVGLALIGQVWQRLQLDGLGVLAGLLAAATLAGRFVLAEKGLRRHDPLVLAALGTTVSATALVLAGLVVPFPFGVLGAAVPLAGLSVPGWAVLGWAGVIGMAAGLLLSVAAQRRLPPTSASLIATLEIVAGAALAYLVLDERMTPMQLTGAGVLFAGVVVAQLALRRPTAPPPAGPDRPPPRLVAADAGGRAD